MSKPMDITTDGASTSDQSAGKENGALSQLIGAKLFAETQFNPMKKSALEGAESATLLNQQSIFRSETEQAAQASAPKPDIASKGFPPASSFAFLNDATPQDKSRQTGIAAADAKLKQWAA